MRSILITLGVLLAAAPGFAQSHRGTITGTVSPAGAVVANAPIQARNVATGAVYEASTSSAVWKRPAPARAITLSPSCRPAPYSVEET
jgi:hypothetical protein